MSDADYQLCLLILKIFDSLKLINTLCLGNSNHVELNNTKLI